MTRDKSSFGLLEELEEDRAEEAFRVNLRMHSFLISAYAPSRQRRFRHIQPTGSEVPGMISSRIKSVLKTRDSTRSTLPHNFATNETTTICGERDSNRGIILEQC